MLDPVCVLATVADLLAHPFSPTRQIMLPPNGQPACHAQRS
jgi:hypothetical protein